jgi:hypothetical protein
MPSCTSSRRAAGGTAEQGFRVALGDRWPMSGASMLNGGHVSPEAAAGEYSLKVIDV